jgi:hypothetical protein
MFPEFTETAALAVAQRFCSYATKGPLGEGTFVISDARGDSWEFTMESFAIPQGDVLTLAVISQKLASQVVVSSELPSSSKNS